MPCECDFRAPMALAASAPPPEPVAVRVASTAGVRYGARATIASRG